MGTENLTSEAIEQPAGTEQATEPVQTGDLYDAELAAAQRELAAQEGNAEGRQAEEAPPEGEPTIQAEPDALPPKEEPKVPVSAIYKERKHRQAVELENARLQGELDAMRRMQATESEQQAQAAAQATDPLSQMEAEQDALAEKFDAGELSALDWQRQNRALQKQIDEARLSQRETQAIRSDQSLEAHAAQLVKDYPVLNAITDQQAAILSDLAYAEAAREGKPIGTGVEATKELRTRIAVLANKLYGGAGQTTQPKAGGQTLSQEALAREAKLDLQMGMPPDVSRMGSAASGVSMSEEEVLDRLNRLPDDEAMKLLNTMPALKARITGELGLR